MDSGSTHHICNDLSMFTEYTACTDEFPVQLGNSSELSILGIGCVSLSVGNRQSLSLQGVLHVPTINSSLISVYYLLESGYDVTFSSTDMCCVVLFDGAEICSLPTSNNLWNVRGHSTPHRAAYSVTADMWHLKYNHLNEGDLKLLHRKGLVKGLDIKPGGALFKQNCRGCAVGKQHREDLVPLVDKAPTQKLDLVHSDLVGPLSRSVNGHKYILTFIDDCSRMSWIYVLKSKNETFDFFKEWQAHVERQTGLKVRALRTDKGGEYISSAQTQYMKDLGMVHQTTMAGTPQSNGIAERFNETLIEAVRCMLHTTGTRKGLWAEAAFCANHTKQRSPHSALKGHVTPYQVWHGVQPGVAHLKVFGCQVSVLIQPKYRKKLDAKSFFGTFVGYGGTKRGYRIWTGHRVVESRDVIFYENNVLQSTILPPGKVPPTHLVDLPFDRPDEEDTHSVTGIDHPDEPVSSASVPVVDLPQDGSDDSDEEPEPEKDPELTLDLAPSGLQVTSTPKQLTDTLHALSAGPLSYTELEENVDVEEQIGNLPAAADPTVLFPDIHMPIDGTPPMDSPVGSDEDEDVPPGPRRGTRQRQAAQRLTYDQKGVPSVHPVNRMAHMSISAIGRTPESYAEAMSCPERDLWDEAVAKEYGSVVQHQTFTWANLPLGRKAVKSKWIFKLKPSPLHPNGVRYKARLVAMGYSQREGIDFHETYAPVMKIQSFRTLCAIAVEEGMHIHHMDVTTAFLYGDLEEEIYLAPPDGITPPPGSAGMVWRLQKALYGLKQSPRCWNSKIDKYLVQLGFVQSQSDLGLYVKGTGPARTLVLLYVDDVTLASRDLSLLNQVKGFLSSEFDMVDFGDIDTILGIKVTRDWKEGTLTLSQADYITDILFKFRQDKSHTKDTPLPAGTKLVKAQSPSTPEEEKQMELTPYRKAVGCILYLVNCTRPDIAQAVSVLCRFGNNPGPAHWKGVQHLLQYLKRTAHHGLVYRRTGLGLTLTGYCDADWGSDMERRRSTSAYVFLLAGAAVSWHSKLQTSCAQSTGEAEKVAIGMAALEINYVWGLMREFGSPIRGPVQVWGDSTAAQAMVDTPICNEKTKHIDMKWIIAYDTFKLGRMRVDYVHTSLNVSDLLTKSVTGAKTSFCREGMGVLDVRPFSPSARRDAPLKLTLPPHLEGVGN